GRGIPARVEHEYVVGFREGEPETAGFEADEEDRGIAGAEGVDDPGAVRGGTVEILVPEPAPRTRLGRHFEERGELGEHEHPVSLRCDVGDIRDGGIEYGGFDVVVLVIVDQGSGRV